MIEHAIQDREGVDTVRMSIARHHRNIADLRIRQAEARNRRDSAARQKLLLSADREREQLRESAAVLNRLAEKHGLSERAELP